jgi:hypothetical protein
MPSSFEARLREHEAKAARIALTVLVWGPAPGDSLEYRKRCEIRDTLRAEGHDAAFSEDLLPKNRAVDDPLDEELLQADSADLIIVLYQSRGTQTEVDVLLGYPRFAEKALIFVSQETHAAAYKSVSGGHWKKLEKIAQIVEYTAEQLNACLVVGQAHDWAEKCRRAIYIAQVKRRASGE